MIERKVLAAIGVLGLAVLLSSAFSRSHRVVADGFPHPSQFFSIRTVMKFKSIPDRDQTLLLLNKAPGENGFVLTELYFSEDRGIIANGVAHGPRINRGFDLLEDRELKWTDPSTGGGILDVNNPPKWYPGLHFRAGSKIQLEGQVFSAAKTAAQDFMLVTLVGYTY